MSPGATRALHTTWRGTLLATVLRGFQSRKTLLANNKRFYEFLFLRNDFGHFFARGDALDCS
jgi:hypothetical protein